MLSLKSVKIWFIYSQIWAVCAFLINFTISVVAIAPQITSIAPNFSLLSGGGTLVVDGSNFVSVDEYRLDLSVSNMTANNLTDEVVLLRFNTQTIIASNKMKNDCSDIRVVDPLTNNLLSYWLESGCNTTDTLLWIKIPILAANSTKNIYISYQGSTSTRLNTSNLNEIFPVLSLSSNALWMSANRNVIRAANGRVTTWNSNSSATSAVQTTNTYRPNFVVNGINNLPALSFNGTSHYLRILNDLQLARNIQGATGFVVIKPNTIKNSPVGWERNILEISTESNTSKIRYGLRNNLNKLAVAGRRLDNQNVQTLNYGSFVRNEVYATTGILDYQNTDAFLYKNNQLIGSSTNFQTAGSTQNTNSASVMIGASPNQNQGFYSGLLSEVIYFKTVLTQSQIDKVWEYLNKKYMISCDFGCTNLTSQTIFTPTVGSETTGGSVVTVGGKACLNVVVVSSTQITCVIPSSATAGVVNLFVRNPDLGQSSNVNFEYVNSTSLGFQIRNQNDTGAQNLCDLGTIQVDEYRHCSYRLKISNSHSGFYVYVRTSGPLMSGGNSIQSSLSGNSGLGGSQIDISSIGTELYGAKITPGNLTGGSVIIANNFDAGGLNSVKYDYTSAQLLLTGSGSNNPASSSDLINTTLVEHNLTISNNTKGGEYTQNIIYTVVPSF